MKPEDREEIVEVLHEIEAGLRIGKANAYAGKTDNDTLGNFKRNAARWGMTKYQTWGIYFGKHIDTIEQAVKENPEAPTDPTEGLLGRINDARVYLEILACMLEEDGLITVRDGEEKPSKLEVLQAVDKASSKANAAINEALEVAAKVTADYE